MTFPDEAFQALVELLGEEYVSRDPVITHAYSRCFTSPNMRAPQCVVLPKDREEIQEIYRLANQHGFKVIPTSTHLISSCQPTSGEFNYVTIDPKRMDRMWIDQDNMVAVVEPYVTFARLQTEAMKSGLTCYIPSGGAQTSVLANLVFQGFNMQSYRLGAGSRSMLAMEWVMPTGEIMRTGSASAMEDDFFWGEGPGVDLRGMIKGTFGFFGGIGMCTRIGIKLHPWPGPKRFPCQGLSPDKRCIFPHDQVRIFTIDFTTLEDVINAMYEIGHAEIAARCIHLRRGWLPAEGSLSQEEFWAMWESQEYQAEVHNMLAVVLEALTSKKQLDYEEAVLRDIVDENNGRFITGKLHELASTILVPDLLYRPHLLFRGFRAAGNFVSVKLALDSLDHAALMLRNGTRLASWYIKDKIPPFLDDEGESGYINPYDFSHMGHYELPILYEAKFEAVQTAARLIALQVLEDIRSRTHPGGFLFSFIIDWMGPWMGKFHRIIRGVKVSFDPNNVSNPPWPMPIWREGLKGRLEKYWAYLKIVKGGG
jgi:glycolate oxidase